MQRSLSFFCGVSDTIDSSQKLSTTLQQKIIHNTPILNGLYKKAFLAAIKKYGVPDEEVFQTPDLFEGRNIAQVTLTLYSLGPFTNYVYKAR